MEFVPIEGVPDVAALGSKIEDAIIVDGLLDELERLHPDWCAVFEMKYFLGLKDEEIATVMHPVSLRTMQRMSAEACSWLHACVITMAKVHDDDLVMSLV